MKSLFALILVSFASVGACTANQTGRNSADFMAVDAGEAKCTVKDISDCTDARGGLSCFSRCGFKPSENFCAMEPLEKCLNSKGGTTCYQKHCSSEVHSGPFNPSNGSGGLVKLPASGYGYETFDVESMRYGQPKMVARIKELAIRVYNKTGYKLYVGDLSNASGGNSGRHAGHYDGLEVDIAIMGNTPTVSCYTIWEGCYLRSAQAALIGEILNMGGSTGMLFNDSSVQSKYPGFVGSASGHDNHLHVNWHR
jgi:hypothetical protein